MQNRAGRAVERVWNIAAAAQFPLSRRICDEIESLMPETRK